MIVDSAAVLAEHGAGPHPSHVIECALFKPQIDPGFSDSQVRVLILNVYLASPFFVTSLSQGEVGL